MTVASRILRLQPGEISPVLILGFLLMGNSLALQVSGIVAVSGLLSSGGVNQMLLVILIDFVFILLLSGVQSLVVDRFNRVKLVSAISLGMVVIFVGIRALFALGAPDWLNYGVMFLVAEQQFFTFPLIFWVLANDVFSIEQTRRIFPLISSGSFVGELSGIGIAALFPAIVLLTGIRSEEVLFLNAAIYLAIFLLLSLGLRKVRFRQTVRQRETVKETLSEGWGFVREVHSFRYLMLAILGLAFASIVLEFRFLVISNAAFPQHLDYQRFYSLYRLAISLACFAVQTFLASRILTRFDLKNVFFLLPIVTVIGAIGIGVYPSVGVAAGAMILFMLVRQTIHEAAVKSFEALVPEERRGRVSTFMGGYLPAIGIILGCIVTGATIIVGQWLGQDLHLIYLAVAVIVAGTSLFAIFKMRAVYDSSLLNWRLKRRQRGGSRVLDKLDF